jgi:hypothetical protein
MKRHCGECALCCRVMGVPEVKKDWEWCPHCRPGNRHGACSIYESRPERCRDFHCQWLLDKRFPDYWFPKMSKIVVDTKVDDTGTWVYFVVDPVVPDRWRQEPWFSDIKTIARQGLAGLAGVKWHTLVLVKDERIAIGL